MKLKPVNIKLILAKFLLRVHPDVIQREGRTILSLHESVAAKNEEAMKLLNAFIDAATAGCNGHLRPNNLTMRTFDLEFFIPTKNSKLKSQVQNDADRVHIHGQAYMRIRHKAEISESLMEISHQALSSLNPTNTHRAAVQWRKYTNTVMCDLFVQGNMTVMSNHPNGHLIPWVLLNNYEGSLYTNFLHDVLRMKRRKLRKKHHYPFVKPPCISNFVTADYAHAGEINLIFLGIIVTL